MLGSSDVGMLLKPLQTDLVPNDHVTTSLLRQASGHLLLEDGGRVSRSKLSKHVQAVLCVL